MTTTIQVKSSAHAETINITGAVAQCVPTGFSGACMVFCLHTTAGLTINENADRDVVGDLLGALERIVPWRHAAYKHMEGNSAAHVKSSLLGVALTVPVQDGKLMLGTWQGIFFCEFDGPRSRRVAVQLLPGAG